MQQKKIGDILYVFDVTPYEITEDTSAEIIKVQEECVAGFKALNASLADKIVAYNYHAMVAQVPVWAPYVDDVSPELAWSSNSATVTIGADDNVFPTLTNPYGVTVTYNSTVTGVATVDEYGNITLVSAGTTDIWAIFAGNDTYTEQVVTYRLNVEEDQRLDPELSFLEDNMDTPIGNGSIRINAINPNMVSPITYSSSDTSVATIDQITGEVTFVAVGTTTISASFAGDSTYKPQTVSYTLTVRNPLVYVAGLHFDDSKFNVTINGAAASYVDEYYDAQERFYNYIYGPYTNGTVVNVYPTVVPSTFKNDEAEWVNDHWTGTVSDSLDLYLDGFYRDPYTVTIEGDSVEDMNIYRNEFEDATTTQEWADGSEMQPDTQIDIYPINGNTSDYTVTGATLVNDHWTVIVEDNLTITVNAINQ